MIGPRSPHEHAHEWPMPCSTVQRSSGECSVIFTARTVTA